MRIIVGFQAEGTTPPHIRTLRVTVPSGSTQGHNNTDKGGGGGGGNVTADPRVTHHLVIEEGEEELEEEDHLGDELDYPKADKMGECSLAIIDKGLSRLFYWLGVKIGESPSYFIIIPLFMALLMGTGMQRLIYIDDPEYLFSPVDGAAKTERLVIEELFPMNYTHRFHPSRFVRPGRFARLFVSALDGGTLLRQKVFQEIQDLDKLIHNISIVWDEDEYRYDNLCATWEGDCYENDVMELGDSMADIESKKINLTWPFFLTPNTYKTLGFPFIFGGYKISNRSTIEHVKALQLNYFIAVNTHKQDIRGEIWEQKVLDVLDAMEGKWKHIKVARLTVRTLAQELEKNTFSVLPYFSVTAIWMIAFMIITCMMMDWVKSKPWLGIVGVISACLGSFAAFGLVCYCGVEFIGINMAAPFLMLALDGGTLLRQKVFQEIQDLDKLIHNISIVWDEDEYRYDNLCATWEGDCYENDVMELGDSMADIESKKINLTWPFFLTPNTYKTLGFPFIFGGYKISNRSTIEHVKALQLNYFIAVNTHKQDIRGEIWEQKVLDVLDAMEGKWKHIKVARLTVRTLAQELEKNTFSVLPYFSVTAIWMIAFMIITCMMMDWVKSKPWLGIVGVISACLGSFAAFGLVCYCGVEFIGINMAAPFLMLGIGIDDTFVMLASWRRTSPHDPVPQRMGETYAEAAVSITITSITDMLSFWVGVITPFPCVQIFSIYSGAAVVATYIWHIFFFGGAIAWSGYHEAENRHSFLCWYTATPRSKTKGKSMWYRLWCTGGIDPDDPYNPKDNPDHGIMVFFRDYWGAFLNLTPVKIVVLAVFIAYLGVSCYGITKTQEGLERRKLTRYDSYAATFFDKEDQFFRDYPYRIQVVVAGELEYSNKTVQNNIEKMMRQFETSPYCSPQFTESWLRNFLNYVERSREIFDFNITTEEQFIKTLTEEYVDSSSFYYDDIKFNEDKTRIVASRFVIQSVNISNSNKERDMAETLREIARNQTGFNVTVFHPFFVFFDQFLLIRQTSINCVAIAAFIMMGVSLVFIPSPLCSLWVAFSIVSIEAGVVGFMALWNVNLDAISMMNLIMCIGFSVDFSAHISYAYIAAKVDTPDERVKSCLYSLGLPIVQGAVSTVLGVAALLVAPSYIFITFFKVIFLVIFIAAMHGLLLLPVLLSLFGPGSCKKFCGDDDTLEMMSVPDERKDKVVPYSFVVTPAGLDPKLSHGTDKYGRRWSTAQGFPGNMGLHGGQFVNGGVIPRVNGLKTTKAASPPSRNSLERDLGIGTSGEDESSESSLSKKNKRSAAKLNHLKELYNNEGYLSDDEELTHSAPPAANGVVHQQQPRRAAGLSAPGGTLTNSLNHPRHSSNNSHINNNNTISNTRKDQQHLQRIRSGSLPQNAVPPDPLSISGVPNNSTLPNGNARRKSNSRGSYVSESKFP